MAVGVPGLILWGIGIPALTLFLLIKNRKNLSDAIIKSTLGFLYLGYNTDKFFWEFVILYRKIAIAFISVFLISISVHVQALTVMLVLLVSFYFQNRK
jgi:hypothetical protein